MRHPPRPDPVVVELASGIRYPIRFGPLDGLAAAMDEVELRASRCLVVTDANVSEHYGERVRDALEAAGREVLTVVVPAGEESKSSRCLDFIHDTVLPWGIDRMTPLVALGGGVVGDLAGYAAATLLRGLPLVHVPTTLLAQVDSSIGGKTGINHAAGKNLIGAFHQPRLVWSDPETLSTLPRREWTSGVAEVVKHALIGGDPLLRRLQYGMGAFLDADPDMVGAVIHEAATVKARIVERDERESGVRAHLNFGHTFGHALERTLGYGTITHGEAVAIGMKAALHLSRTRKPTLPFDRAMALVAAVPVPPLPPELSIDELMSAMVTDKKIVAGTLRFVVLEDLGAPNLVADVRLEAVRSAWRYALGRDG